MKLDKVIYTYESDVPTCQQGSSGKTTTNDLMPYIIMGTCNSLIQQPIKIKGIRTIMITQN